MKKTRCLNKYLSNAIADMGHGDFLIIADAGFPIPSDQQRIDLAIEPDKPGILEIVDLIMHEMIYERCIVADEQQKFNSPLHSQLVKMCDRCKIETMPQTDIIATMPKAAKYIVRTGAFEPWGNVILYSGVDAPVWFQKPGVITPDFYQERANYTEDGAK